MKRVVIVGGGPAGMVLAYQLASNGVPVRVLDAQGPAATLSTSWVDAGRWRKLEAGMSELEVVSLLGPPTSMRDVEGARVLFYAMELGASGFLGGSVKFRNRAVIEVQQPVLQ